MYRLGVRLDDRWRPWVEADLGDPGWKWRHRLAVVLSFAAMGVVVLPVLMRFRLVTYSIGPFLGALIGQLWFLGLKQERARRLHLRPPTNPFTSGLDFRGRVAMTLAIFVLVFAGSTAAIRVIHDAVSPCRAIPPAAAAAIERAGRDAVGFGEGASVALEEATSDVVAREVSFSGAKPVIGTWAVRRDGTVFPLDQVARDATDALRTGPGTTFGLPHDYTKRIDQVRRCTG